MFEVSETQLLRRVHQDLARRACAGRTPRVLWATLTETGEAFATRVEHLRQEWRGRVLAVMPHGMAAPFGVTAVHLPAKHFWLFHPDAPSRYRVGSGGRESGKSWSAACAIVLLAITRKARILCAREYQTSLRESVHALLVATIERLKLDTFFSISDRQIECVATGSEIIFTGLATNAEGLKSLEGVNLAYIEQAETISARSLEIMVPTIRARGSECWLVGNPDDPAAPFESYRDRSRPNVRYMHTTFEDNPFAGDELREDRERMQRNDPDAYAHIYLGEPRIHSEAQVFRGKYFVEAFTPKCDDGAPLHWRAQPDFWDGPYQGIDHGFSQDPAVFVRCWAHRNTLYIEHEAYKVGCDIDRLPALFDEVPNARKYITRADNARPETNSYLNRNGYSRVQAVDKWKGSVEDGVAFMRSFDRIVVHPRCKHTAEEMHLYRHKVDRLSGDVLPDLEDRNNHCIDAIRYALAPLIKNYGVCQIRSLRI